MIIGLIEFLDNVIPMLFSTTGENPNINRYIEIGLMVPLVSSTVLNYLKIGWIAKDESKHAKFKTGSLIDPSVGFGSRISANC